MLSSPTDLHNRRADLSPQLLFNIDPENRSASNFEITLRPSPFGSRRPTIPVAKTVTIARVGSPFSMDRAYQPLFLQALQDYFKRATRLVKQGDVITVGINTDDLLRYSGPASEEGEQEAVGEADLGSVWLSSCLPLKQQLTLLGPIASSGNANELVYFIVTNVEHSVPSRIGETSSLDMYVGATVGELGCWIDTAITRMVQTGIEHSRVPAMAQYFGTGIVLHLSSCPHYIDQSVSLYFATTKRYSAGAGDLIWKATSSVFRSTEPASRGLPLAIDYPLARPTRRWKGNRCELGRTAIGHTSPRGRSYPPVRILNAYTVAG